MNVKRIKYIAILLVTLMVSGCSDSFLEDKDQSGIFDETTFENEQTAGWYLDGLYYNYWYGYNKPGEVLVGKTEDRTSWTEESGGISDYHNPDINYNESDNGSDYYGKKLGTSAENNSYSRIRSCNFLINGIDEFGKNLSEGFRKTAKGQCYFLRAMQYFDLIRVYGGVPISLTVEEPSPTNEDIKLPRETTANVVKQIYEDLDAAASLLPDKWDTDNYGRFTRAAALAMKSRVALTFASPLFNPDWDNQGNERWKTALEYSTFAESELNKAGYGLYGSSIKDWNEMFLIDNSFCQEAIMVKLLSPQTSGAENNEWENSIRLTSQSGSGGIGAPKEMIDLFPMADGSRPTKENGYDAFKFFLDRDPRFYRTFAFSGCKWGYSDDANDVIWTYRWGYTNGAGVSYDNSDANELNSPALVRKMSNEKAMTPFNYSGTDIMDYRFSELILNIAECYAAQGNISKTIEYLAKIRQRVGIPSDNNYGLGVISDKYQALEACLYERRVELAYEGKRFFDIQRWMLYNDDNDGAISGITNNTCEKLRVNPINGTCRTGHYLMYKTTLDKNEDPLKNIRSNYAVDPDAEPEVFEESLHELAKFYEDNFELGDLTTPMDINKTGEAVNIQWRPQYYLFGLTRTILSNNPWLEQTIGWKDANSGMGTFNYQK